MIKKNSRAREKRRCVCSEKKKKDRTNQSRCVNLSQNSFVVYTYLQKSTRTRAHLLPDQVSQRELRATVAMQDIQE